ncbi:MAG: phosphodiesterase [Actinomycetales bacterium]|nr:phosphodiesterase [Actinomycetales bacterium]
MRAVSLPPSLVAEVERAGYYPELVDDVLDVALAGEDVRAYLVHQETTFDRVEVRRHVTVLVLTPTRLIVAHADDHDPDDLSPEPYASASTESVPLHRISSVVLSHVVSRPERHRSGTAPRELSLTIGWGALTRVDLEPATCADPDCEADHGYTGTVAVDDITVRLSAAAEGTDAVEAAVAFARALSAATAERAG